MCSANVLADLDVTLTLTGYADLTGLRSAHDTVAG
jgi:hypothetical protein